VVKNAHQKLKSILHSTLDEMNIHGLADLWVCVEVSFIFDGGEHFLKHFVVIDYFESFELVFWKIQISDRTEFVRLGLGNFDVQF